MYALGPSAVLLISLLIFGKKLREYLTINTHKRDLVTATVLEMGSGGGCSVAAALKDHHLILGEKVRLHIHNYTNNR